MTYYDAMQVPVWHSSNGKFRAMISETSAKILDVVELKSNEILLFIVDPNGTDKQVISDIGFECVRKRARAEHCGSTAGIAQQAKERN